MKTDEYRKKLKELKDWDSFLQRESGLPGPRANLELVQAVADEGDRSLFLRYVALDPEVASTNSPDGFLAVCGVVGLGRLVAEGQAEHLALLRKLASDPRWRVREGVAMGLQRVGDADMTLLLREMKKWSRGNALEKRAVAAALCEPRLLRDPKHVQQVLEMLDEITTWLSKAKPEDRKSEDMAVLKKGLAYCWSVAVVALPEPGKRSMEKWFASPDKDVQWIMRENLKKDRLARMDDRWVDKWKTKLASGGKR